jgi:hypothetical protein
MSSIDTVTGLLGSGGLRFGEAQPAGALTVVPVFHDGARAPYRRFAEVAGSGLVEVGEVGGGSVPQLQVVNRCDHPVLLVEGEVLSGLRQTRTLNTTVLVSTHSVVTVPVACIEAGRWGSARPFDREVFHASPRVRHSKNLGIQAREAVVSALVVGAAVVHLAAVWPPAGTGFGPEVRLNRPSRRGSWFGGTR